MRHVLRRTILLPVFAIAGLCGSAAAHPDQPLVLQGMLSAYDIESLKAGDWVEYEEDCLEEKIRTRLACVAVEADVAWIEYTGINLAMWTDTVLLFAVGRKDRMISRAYWGDIGQLPREVDVTPQDKVDETSAPTRTGTAVVSEDTLKVKDEDLKCEKVALDYKSGESRFRNRVWTSSEIPFRYAPPTAHLSNLEWEGKASRPGGMVKREIENPNDGSVVETVLVGWGHDATRSLREK